MTANVKIGPGRVLTDILGIDTNGKGGTAGGRNGGSLLMAAQLGIIAAGITTQSLDGSSWMTFAAPNTKAFLLSTFDHAGNLTRTFDQGSGRIDFYDSSAAGHAVGPAVALNFVNATPTIGDNLGHYAYRGNDSNGNRSTFAYMLANAKSVTPNALSSSLSLSVMKNVDASAGGNGQPNWGILIDGSTSQVTMPVGATIAATGNYSTSAATGPTHLFTNTTNSRTLTIGVADNFNGTVNAAGGGSLNLQNGGTTGISMSSLIVSIGQSIPARVGVDYRLTKTSNYSVVQADSGTDFDNSTAAGEVDFTLPSAPTSGTNFGFWVITAQIVKVIAPASTTINVGGAVSAAAGNIASSQLGAYVRLSYMGGNKYAAKSATGTGGTAGAGGWTVT